MALQRKLEIHQTDSNGDSVVTNFNSVNTNLTAEAMNTGVRKLMNLTTNTYIDTYVIDTQSLNEMVSGNEG